MNRLENITPQIDEGYVDAPTLLEHLFPDKRSRPSVKTVRRLVIKGAIPFIRFGGGIYFKPREVKSHLERQPSASYVLNGTGATFKHLS